MRIFDRLVECVPADAIVESVSIGIFWTFVKTQYGSGVSATAHRWVPDPPGALIPFSGGIEGMRVLELVSQYESAALPARALANASVSASFPSSEMTGTRHIGRAQDLIEKLCARRKRHIGLIGHFHFADELRAFGHELDVFELDGRCGDGDIPSSRIPERLPQADVVVMTSSTILTHTTEDILSHCGADAVKIIVGPTVPLHPVLWEFGFDAVCGSVVHDAEQVNRAVREGGSHRQLTGCEKINFIRPELCEREKLSV